MIRWIRNFGALLVLPYAMMCLAAGSVGLAAQPNIVVFVPDDLGWHDVGYHDSEIATPNLDQLARTGVRLEHFYVYPTCSPTRAGFITGRNPSQFNILSPIGGRSKQALPKEVMTLPRALKQLGYVTAITGKWHLGLTPQVGPRQYGFDYSYGYLHGQLDPYTHRYKNGDRTWHRNDQFIEEEGHVTDLITREAIGFMEKNHDKPFFLYVPFSVPHTPLNEPLERAKSYADKIENLSRRNFAAAVSHMDDSIGKICAALDGLKLRDNTMIVFFSDNGGANKWDYSPTEYQGRYPANDRLGDNRPLRGWKGSLYEGGIRVPAFVHWPKRLPPRTVDQVASVMDMLPTLVAAASQAASSMPTLDKEIEGTNILLLLTGEGTLGQRTLYWNVGSCQAVRVGDFKLIQYRRDDKCELFNLTDDPYEQNDLAAKEPQRLQQLLECLRKEQTRNAAKS